MQFTKLHGAGNDFIAVNGRARNLDWSKVAERILDRHFGVGADGLLVAVESDTAPIRMREFNPDGSEAEMSGNGIRCFVKYALEGKIAVANESGELRVETGAGIRDVAPHWEEDHIVAARVDMGAPVLRWSDVPADPSMAGPSDRSELDVSLLGPLGVSAEELLFDAPLEVDGESFKVTAVSMGNPHAVAQVQTPVSQVPLSRLGPLVEHHPAFPQRTNFHIMNLLGRNHLVSLTWERGAGRTLACGTGASAMVVSARLHGLVDDTVTVQVPGGELKVTWPGHGPVLLEGPVQEVCTGEWRE
jgi:diaminopimelate epimerase